MRNVDDLIIPSSSGVHNGLASLLAKGILEVGTIVLGQEITGNGLTTVLVDSLEDLVTGRVSQTREQRDELSSDGSGGLVLENDLVQLAGTGDLEVGISITCPCAEIETGVASYTALVAHQSLRNGVDLMAGLANISKYYRDVRCGHRRRGVAYRVKDSQLSNTSRTYRNMLAFCHESLRRQTMS